MNDRIQTLKSLDSFLKFITFLDKIENLFLIKNPKQADFWKNKIETFFIFSRQKNGIQRHILLPNFFLVSVRLLISVYLSVRLCPIFSSFLIYTYDLQIFDSKII
jgi:hypothetical protein